MADTVLTLKQIEDIFFTLTCQMLGLDPTAPDNQGKIRLAWPTTGAPAWKISDDIVFLRITPQDDKLTRQQDIIYNPNDDLNTTKETGYTRVHKVDWTLYGPNSYDNADLIRFNIFKEDYSNILKTNNLFLITDVPMPVRLPELYNGQWWERTDFNATFNEMVVRRETVPYINSTDFRIISDR
jgi:hypothetical protein